MTTLPSLKVLQDNRDELLLAEVAALLHDVGKFCSLHIESHSQGGTKEWSNNHAYKALVDQPQNYIRLSNAVVNLKKPDALNNVLNATSPKASDYLPQIGKDVLAQTTMSLLGQTYSLAELIMLGTPGFATDKNRTRLLDGKDGWLAAALGVCHSEAHHDKQEPAKGEGAQTWPDVFISTAFGYEEKKVVVDPASPENLNRRLQNLPWTNLLSSRSTLFQEFVHGLGDTRRPINEVTLDDWSATVAALYKSSLATCVLESRQREIRKWASWRDRLIDHDLRWRLLRVNFDVLGLYVRAVKIADLLGYQQAVEKACKEVKQLVEEECPLGNAVYCDTTGIYFTFPDIGLPADLVREIRNRVEGVEMELAPRIVVTVGNGATAAQQLKGLLGKARKEALVALAQPFNSQNLSARWQQQWTIVGAGQWEVCPVCRLRPMEEGQEACETCMNRRGSRVQEWLENPRTTIWIDEIADHNDRVALVVGKFGLDDWLSGDLVQTMLVKAVENNPGACVPKNPSPARLRRVWETCQLFWSETVVGGVLAGQPFGGGDVLSCRRVAVVPDDCKGWQENVPYDGIINGRAVSLLWQESEKRFITIINLQLGVSQARDEIGLIGEWHGRICMVSLPRKPGQTRTFTVQQVQSLNGEPIQMHAPYLSLLESPDRFLALVPAAEALEIGNKIRKEYQEQFGKVQNRLPLFLGIVFFPRKLPLMAVMDVARRMLAMDLPEETWQVECVTPQNTGPNIEIRLSLQHNRIDVTIPVKMRGNSTDDLWYPYFFVQHFADGTHDNRALRFQHDGRWLVHAKELKKDDQVAMTSSRFAYLCLESTARRFRFDPQQDVLLLDELPRLMKMWTALKKSGITMTGLRNVQALLESKGAAWGRDSEEFERLTRTTLQEAGLFERKDKDGNPIPDVITPQDVTSERFAHCLELYLHILKQKIG